MTVKKQYAAPDIYEKKLQRVMERMEVTEYNFDWSRYSAWIEFFYKGQLYRFDHSVEKAKERGFNLAYGSDVFAQLVITLEDLARMAERGIYELQTWISGMKFLPPPVILPECFKALGFTEIPSDVAEINTRFKTLAKQVHPDMGGNEESFIVLQNAAKEAANYLSSMPK